MITKTPKQEVISFPDVSESPSGGGGGSKRGRGRPPKSGKSSNKSSTQAGLITETVGSYIDEHVWQNALKTLSFLSAGNVDVFTDLFRRAIRFGFVQPVDVKMTEVL